MFDILLIMFYILSSLIIFANLCIATYYAIETYITINKIEKINRDIRRINEEKNKRI